MSSEAALRLLLSHEVAWKALINCVKVDDANTVGSALARVFAASGRDFELVKYCIIRETEETDDPALLFRSTGIRSAVVAKSGALHGQSYLQKIIGPVLNNKMHKSSSSFEIDPFRLGNNGKELQRNCENIVAVCNHLLAALLEGADQMPPTLRKTYECARRFTAAKFPEQARRVAGSLFFLRLLCPALVSPETHGLAKSRLSDYAQRTHVLLAKLMQCVANEVPPFEKEAYMQPLNAWVAAAIPSMRRFFKIALNPVKEESLEPHKNEALQRLHAIPNPTSINDSKAIWKYLSRHQTAFRSQLITLGASDVVVSEAALLLAEVPVRTTTPELLTEMLSPRTRDSTVELQPSRSSPAIVDGVVHRERSDDLLPPLPGSESRLVVSDSRLQAQQAAPMSLPLEISRSVDSVQKRTSPKGDSEIHSRISKTT